jgi:hypothetical protein
MPTAIRPMPAHESSQVRSAQSEHRRTGEGPGEPERCSQKLAALIAHALFDDLVRPQHQRRRDRQPERIGGVHVDDQLEFRGLLDREVDGTGTLEDLVD